MMFDFMNEAMQSRFQTLEAAIQRFVECGVTLDRMKIVEFQDHSASVLCVDGVGRFIWRMVYPDEIMADGAGLEPAQPFGLGTLARCCLSSRPTILIW